MEIAFITSGVLPVPSVRGGAVETLLDALAQENEKSREPFTFTFFTVGDEKAKRVTESSKLKNTKYEYIKIPLVVNKADEFLFWLFNNIFQYKKAKKLRFVFQRAYFIWRCHCLLKKNKSFDRVVAVNHPTLLAATERTGYMENKQVIYYAHNDFKFSRSAVLRLSQCESIFSVSSYLNEKIKTHIGYKENSKKCYVVKNGVSLDVFRPYSESQKKDTRRNLGFEEKEKIVLFAGRLVPEKGVQFVIKAVNEISEKEKNVKLVIVGANSFGLKVRTKFEEKLLAMTRDKNNILFTGFVENVKLPDYYNIADIIVLPSICEEAAGLAMIETLACGGAVITTYSGGISEYVKGSGAIQIDAKKQDFYEQLKSSILYLIQHPEKRKEMEECAIKGTEKLSYKEYFDNFSKIIKV